MKIARRDLMVMKTMEENSLYKPKFRIWHSSDFTKPAFTREVAGLDEAIMLLDLLADYDLYHEDRIEANAQGLQIYNEAINEWEDWEDEEGNDIDYYRGKGDEDLGAE